MPPHDVAHHVVGEERHLPELLARLEALLDADRHAHALLLHEQQVQAEQRGHDEGQNRHMQAVEPGQGRAGHLVAAAQEPHHEAADDGHGARNPRPDLGGEERQLVPRQEIAAEAEREHQEQQQHAAQPRQLARLPVGLQEERAEHVHEGQQNEQVRRPAVDVPDEPPELHLRHDELDALVGLVGARPVVQQEHDAGRDLHADQEQRHAAHVVPDLVGVDRHALLGHEVADAAEIDPIVEPLDDALHVGLRQPRETTTSSCPGSPRS
jgi:hypothetical protein